MTADPIASIPYPVRTQAPNIANTMKPAIDATGALFKSGLPRGGTFTSSPGSIGASPTNVPLTYVSGDSDLLVSGKFTVPAGWGGVWTITVAWASATTTGTRNFIDVQINSNTWSDRFTKNTGEDRQTFVMTRKLAAGDTLTLAAYNGVNTVANVFTVDIWRTT